jgi:hypothetical protein
MDTRQVVARSGVATPCRGVLRVRISRRVLATNADLKRDAVAGKKLIQQDYVLGMEGAKGPIRRDSVNQEPVRTPARASGDGAVKTAVRPAGAAIRGHPGSASECLDEMLTEIVGG